MKIDMERLDHFVVHIDNPSRTIADLKSILPDMGFPFRPEWGKGTRGFKASNIWIGQQYFEIISILKPDGGGWIPYWVEKHQKGIRGIYCLFLATYKLEQIHKRFVTMDFHVDGPERNTFKWLLFKKTLPWQYILLPEIPGTNMQIGFIQYDKGAEDKFRPYMVPNAKDHGIHGINLAQVGLPFNNEVLNYLRAVFPDIIIEDNQAHVDLLGGKITFTNKDGFEMTFQACLTNPVYSNSRFSFENISVETVFIEEYQ